MEVLEQLDAVLVLGVILQAAFPPPGEPVREVPARSSRDRVHRHGVRVRELHLWRSLRLAMRKFGGREVSLLVVLTVMEGGQRGGLSKKKICESAAR